MAAAIALAVVLVVAVAGMSLAMHNQQQVAGQGGTTRPTPRPRPQFPSRRPRERRQATAPEPTPPPPPPAPTPAVPELLRSGTAARARVINVVDERVVGPVTRSRLTLSVEPSGAEPFEVVIRHAFPTPEARSKVRVGGRVGVRYDPEHHRKVVLDPEADGPGAG